MSDVKSDGTSGGVQGGKEPEPKGDRESTMSRAGHAAAGHAAAAMVQQGSTDPAKYAAYIRRHPELRPSTIAFLHQRFGNEFVMAVLGDLDRPSAAPVSNAAGGAAGAGNTSVADSGKGAAAAAAGAAVGIDGSGSKTTASQPDEVASRQPLDAKEAWPKESIKEGPKQKPAPTHDELRSRFGFPESVDVGDLVVGVGGYHTAVDVPISSHDNTEIEVGGSVTGAPDIQVVSPQPVRLGAGEKSAIRLDVNPKSARSRFIDGRLNLVATWRPADDVGEPDRLRVSIPITGTLREDSSDRIPSPEKKESTAPKERQPERETSPAVQQGVDDAMSRSGMPTQLPAGSRPVTADDHRGSVINAIQGSFGSFFRTITTGKERAETAAGGEVPHDGDLGPLLSLLATVAGFSVVGAASTFGHLAAEKAKAFAGFFQQKTAEKFVENFVKEGIKHVVGMTTSTKPKNIAGLKTGFFDAVTTELARREGSFMAGWAGYEDQLRALESEDLEQVHAQVKAVMAGLGEILERITQDFLVSWSNFLAQAKHGGAMAGWDHGERHGSVGAMQLQDAAEKPLEGNGDPTRANVAPDKMTESVERTGQWAWTKTESGMLEIFVNIDGELRSGGPKMRLADLSTEAKEKLAALPRVGDARLNKIVRIMDRTSVVGSLLITADGYVRDSSESSGARFDARSIAEKVQNLPMGELER